MPEQEADRQVIETIGKRLTTTFTQTVAEEMARAATKGVPTATVLQEALKALLRMSAVVAGNLISPENAAPHEQQVRIDRLHIAFAQAFHRIIEGELKVVAAAGGVGAAGQPALIGERRAQRWAGAPGATGSQAAGSCSSSGTGASRPSRMAAC